MLREADEVIVQARDHLVRLLGEVGHLIDAIQGLFNVSGSTMRVSAILTLLAVSSAIWAV